MLRPLVEKHRGSLSVRQACAALGLCPSTYHRWRRAPRPAKVRTSPRALSAQEREGVNTVLAAAFDRHPERFVHGLPTARVEGWMQVKQRGGVFSVRG